MFIGGALQPLRAARWALERVARAHTQRGPYKGNKKNHSTIIRHTKPELCNLACDGSICCFGLGEFLGRPGGWSNLGQTKQICSGRRRIYAVKEILTTLINQRVYANIAPAFRIRSLEFRGNGNTGNAKYLTRYAPWQFHKYACPGKQNPILPWMSEPRILINMSFF